MRSERIVVGTNETLTLLSGGAALVYLVTLPDGVTPGRMEAAESFSKSFVELVARNSGRNMAIAPFSMDGHGGVIAYLVTIV